MYQDEKLMQIDEYFCLSRSFSGWMTKNKENAVKQTSFEIFERFLSVFYGCDFYDYVGLVKY